MDKYQAAMELIYDARNQRPSTASARRVIRACKALGLPAKEAALVLRALDYTTSNGKPYPRYAVSDKWPFNALPEEAA